MIAQKNIRDHFPIFSHHPSLIYLDNAATTHKPQEVIDAISNFYQQGNANIHRGIYPLAAEASLKYEKSRNDIAQFLNAPNSDDIIFTSGTTESINIVAQSFLEPNLEIGDEVLISAMEHHANLIPWQMACKRKGAVLKVIPFDEKGTLDMISFQSLLTSRVKMVAIVHVSNSLGTVNPIEEIINLAHQKNIPVLVDGAQSIAHYSIDVQKLDVDFFTFSGHKIFGPTGIGVLYGKKQYLTKMKPIQFGGGMIKDVTFEETEFADSPKRFEAGTANIGGVIGLGAAISFVNKIDRKEVNAFLQKIRNELTDKLLKINDLEVIGQAKNKSSIVSFCMKNIHPHDIATFLGAENIAVRAGHHCTQPVMDIYNLHATTRASFSIYNRLEEVDILVEKIKELQQFFK